MNEICTIGSQVWHYGKCAHDGVSADFEFSYAFYDQYTGEVWGRRTVVGGRTIWVYSPRDPKDMDLTIPYEWNPGKEIPAGLMCALIVASAEKLMLKSSD